MPCKSHSAWEEDVMIQTRKLNTQLDLVTRLLCGVLTHIEKHESPLYSALVDGVANDKEHGMEHGHDLEKWWLNHKLEDKRRLAREEEARQAAIEKLRKEAKKLGVSVI